MVERTALELEQATQGAALDTKTESRSRALKVAPAFAYRTTLVVIPTYNESDNLPLLIGELLALEPELDILVVDDGSPDGTGEIAEALGRETGCVTVIHRQGKQGLGTAYVRGFQYALERGYEYVVQMDADFSHQPSDLPPLLRAVKDADVVIGSRNVPGGKTESWSRLRDALSKGGSLYARLMLKLPIRDCTGGFKVLRRRALCALDLDALQSSGFGFQIEVNYACARAGMKFAEIPIRFPNRTRGTSKMSSRIVLEAWLLVLRLRLGLQAPALASGAC